MTSCAPEGCPLAGARWPPLWRKWNTAAAPMSQVYIRRGPKELWRLLNLHCSVCFCHSSPRADVYSNLSKQKQVRRMWKGFTLCFQCRIWTLVTAAAYQLITRVPGLDVWPRSKCSTRYNFTSNSVTLLHLPTPYVNNSKYHFHLHNQRYFYCI